MENKCQKKELDKKNSNKKATKRAKYKFLAVAYKALGLASSHHLCSKYTSLIVVLRHSRVVPPQGLNTCPLLCLECSSSMFLWLAPSYHSSFTSKVRECPTLVTQPPRLHLGPSGSSNPVPRSFPYRSSPCAPPECVCVLHCCIPVPPNTQQIVHRHSINIF